MNKADFWQRFWAATIDHLLCLGLFWIIYETILVSQWNGYTVGKKIMGIRVVSLKGGKVDWVRAFVRSVSKILSGMFFFLGYFWMLWDEDSQTWHDKLAETIVVRD
jgi:uncharacterized RDD family membrane protein YckC